MMKSFSLAFLLLLTAWGYSEALTCYNCYTLTSTTNFHGKAIKGEVMVPCADNITESNTYVCPQKDYVCSIMHLKLGNQNEIMRSCSKIEADVCNNGIPGLEIISCSTCSTDLCNGDNEDPEPPPNNSTCPTLGFDVNLNINLNVYHVNHPVPTV